MKTVIVVEGQTIYDIAIKEYGGYEGVFILLEDNSLDLTTVLTAGDKILVRNVVPELTDNNVLIADYFKANRLNPNSGYLNTVGDYEALDFENFDFNAL
jgi:hypothetical protein